MLELNLETNIDSGTQMTINFKQSSIEKEKLKFSSYNLSISMDLYNYIDKNE